jgi:hypothetical protein
MTLDRDLPPHEMYFVSVEDHRQARRAVRK